MDFYHKNYHMALTFWYLSSNRNGHAPVNGVDMATAATQIKMEDEQRRQCQEILDKIPEHRLLFQQMNMKQEPLMLNGSGDMPVMGSMGSMTRSPGHAPRGRPPASMQNNGVISPDRKHVCPHCYKTFKSRQQLMQHNLVHSNLRKYRCSFCDRAFKQLSHLHQHHRIHTGEKPYRCPLPGCDRAFPQLSNLQHHIRNHDKLVDSTFQCMQCDRAYPNEATLKAHNTRMHLHAKPLDLRQNPVARVTQSSGQPHPTINASSLPTMASPFGHLQNNLNAERSRKRKATRPQQLFMPPSLMQTQGPLTPEEDDDVIIVDPKQTCPKDKDGGFPNPLSEHFQRNSRMGGERLQYVDDKQLRAFQQNLANFMEKEHCEREALKNLAYHNDGRDLMFYTHNQTTNGFMKGNKDFGQFALDMRGRRFQSHAEDKDMVNKNRDVKSSKLPSQFNFPYGPPGFDFSMWHNNSANPKTLDLLNVQSRQEAQDRKYFGSDDERVVDDFEENQRRRRELIMSYHKQYAEKKMRKKMMGENDYVERNGIQENIDHDRHNGNDRPFSRSEEFQNKRAENEYLRQSQMQSSSQEQNGVASKDGSNDMMNNFEFQKERNGHGGSFSGEFIMGNMCEQSKIKAFTNDYRRGGIETERERIPRVPCEVPYNYIGDDIPMCEQSSARGGAREAHHGENLNNQTENDKNSINCTNVSEPRYQAQNTPDLDLKRSQYNQSKSFNEQLMYNREMRKQTRADSGYWSQSLANQRSFDESESANDNACNMSSNSPSHAFTGPSMPLDVFDDPMN